MFERFTERARKAIVLAQEEAGSLRHDFIGTEHLLLGLTAEDEGVAAGVLTSLGVTLDEAREQVESIVGHGEELVRQMPFTPRSKKVLEFSLRESRQMGHHHIGTEHLLLGLVRESEGVAVRVLSNLDVDPDGIRREVLERLGIEEEDSSDRAERWIEEGTYDETFSPGPTGSARTVVRVKGRPRTLLVDVVHVRTSRDGDGPSGTMGFGRLLDRIAGVVEGDEYRSVDEAIERSGELVLERLPAVDEIEVSAIRERWFERRTGSGIIKTRTFRR